MPLPLNILKTAATETATHCPYCAFQCGMILRVEGDKIDVAGDDHFPVNNGQMCIKGFTSAEMLTSPERVLTPLIRGESGVLEEATWEAALDFIAEKIKSIQARHGRDAMACFGSGSLTNEKAYWLGKFARVALKTRNIDYNGRYCMSSAAGAQSRAFGIDRGLPFPVGDIAATRAALLWGSNLADTLPPIMQYFHTMKAAGGRLIVVDPRRTDTARAADLHLQNTPGSDLALANGLLHIAIEEKRIDEAYIAHRTTGFDAVRACVSTYHPARVERITGVDVAKLRAAVRWLAEDSSMVLGGRGPEQQSKGVDSTLAMINLMLALGKVGRPFSGYGTLTGQGNGQGGREHGQKADQLPGYRLIENAQHREAIAKVWNVDPGELPGKGKSAVELLRSINDDVHGLLVMGSNIVVATPDAGDLKRRLGEIELLVVCDLFINETAALADVVLPVTQWAEEEGTLTNFEGRVLLRRKAVSPPDGVRSDLWILSQIARRLGETDRFAAESSSEVFDEIRQATRGGLADYGGITYERIEKQRGIQWPCPDQNHSGTPRLFADRFYHDDGRAKFHAVEHRPAGEEPCGTFPVYFTTGRYKEQYNSGAQTRRVKPLRDARPKPLLQIHPRLARQLGLGEGGQARVTSRRGEVVFDLLLSSDIRHDTVFAPFHYGGNDAANLLTNPSLDPISKMPEFKVCAVRIEPA